MIGYGVGCSEKSVIKLMELDDTFFEEE